MYEIQFWVYRLSIDDYQSFMKWWYSLDAGKSILGQNFVSMVSYVYFFTKIILL